MNFLITDLNIKLDGHKLGFIKNLIEYIEKNSFTDVYHFLVNNSEIFHISKSNSENVKIYTLSEKEQSSFEKDIRFLEKTQIQWNIIEKYTAKLAINHLVLMELDPYQVAIGKKKTNFSIAGIWFRPYHRMQPENDSLLAKFQFWIYKNQKRITLFFALRNKNLLKVFVLNDEELPGLPKNKRFVYLPDPCFQYPQLKDFDLRKKYDVPEGNLILLQFGYIDERKNSENILLALNGLEPEISKNITLLIIGKFRENYEQDLLNLKNLSSEYQLVTLDSFISDSEMESTFSQSDVILRMNINFYGSSGVVGNAANHNKPCIVSSYGVMADQVNKYQMGKIMDPTDINEIRNTLIFYFKNPQNRIIDGFKYRESHSAEAYAKTLLQV